MGGQQAAALTGTACVPPLTAWVTVMVAVAMRPVRSARVRGVAARTLQEAAMVRAAEVAVCATVATRLGAQTRMAACGVGACDAVAAVLGRVEGVASTEGTLSEQRARYGDDCEERRETAAGAQHRGFLPCMAPIDRSFGSSASSMGAPELCDPASRRVCLCRDDAELSTLLRDLSRSGLVRP